MMMYVPFTLTFVGSLQAGDHDPGDWQPQLWLGQVHGNDLPNADGQEALQRPAHIRVQAVPIVSWHVVKVTPRRVAFH